LGAHSPELLTSSATPFPSTITGPGGTWTISGPDVESVAGYSISSFANIVVGGSPDRFVFEPGGSISGNLEGAARFTNTLDYSERTDRVNVNLQTDVASDIGGRFSNISNFIDGSNLYNTIFGPDANWTITGPNAESVAGDTFSSFGNLVGGAGRDQFTFQPGGSVTGNIDGGGGINTLDYSDLAGRVPVNLQTDTASDIGGTFIRISKFTGSSSSENTLTVALQAACDVTGSNSGTIYSQSFTSFQNLVGGAFDQFVFYPGGSLSGNLRGMGGNNVVSYANIPTAVTVNLRTDTAADIGGTFAGISRLVGGTGVDTVVGPNSATCWAITGVNTINVLGLTMSDFPNVTGGSGDDSFAVSGAGELTGKIDGGGGVNSLNYSGYPGDVIVDLLLGNATAVLGGVAQIQNITGGNGNGLLVGDAQANVLVGGLGRNVRIGDAGADSLIGGGADSILIGGSVVQHNSGDRVTRL
jgi:Ca2+-binding RTX toxin-like protein